MVAIMHYWGSEYQKHFIMFLEGGEGGERLKANG